MKIFSPLLITICSLTFLFPAGYGQEENKDPDMISFFLDCYHCDFTFVRQELPFISFVRDPLQADVHILVTDSNTGGGGEKFYMNFLGRNYFKGFDNEYNFTSNQSNTDDDIRKALLKILQAGILQYYSKAGLIGQINIDLEDKENKNADDHIVDRWNKWVFRLESGGQFQKEKSQNEYSIETGISAEKITEDWKTAIEASYGINRENYIDDGKQITNKQDSKNISAEFIKSLNEKWSVGIFGNYSSRTFMNIKNHYAGAAGIQYNFFPWKECNKRVFAIAYGAGFDIYDYNEITLDSTLHDNLLTEIIILELKLIQKWGEIEVAIEGQHYFHDFSKNHLSLESDISVRLTKNLSVFVNIESQLIHDQLYLPAGDASHDDIVLRRRKLATNYEVGGQIGFRFTFGSIYNNVVNERF